MTCLIFILKDGQKTIYEFWTATKPECSDWLSLLKWAHEAGGWSEWLK